MRKSVQNQKITASERAAIFWQVFEGETDWKVVFMAAAAWDDEDARKNPATLAQYTSKWKALNKVKTEISRAQLVKEKYIKKIQDIAYEEGRRSVFAEMQQEGNDTSAASRGRIDYTDPKMQKEKLNEIINGATDAGEALDALKVIIQGQKNDQEAAKNNKIQRFYTPLQCRDCPLYQEKKEILKK